MFVCLSYRNLKDKFSIFSLEFPFFGKLLLIFADYTLYMYMLIRLKNRRSCMSVWCELF